MRFISCGILCLYGSSVHLFMSIFIFFTQSSLSSSSFLLQSHDHHSPPLFLLSLSASFWASFSSLFLVLRSEVLTVTVLRISCCASSIFVSNTYHMIIILSMTGNAGWIYSSNQCICVLPQNWYCKNYGTMTAKIYIFYTKNAAEKVKRINMKYSIIERY